MPIVVPSLQTEFYFKNFSPVPGYHIPDAEGPWIPGEPGTSNKFLNFDLGRNSFAVLLRCEPGSGIKRHYHTGTVAGYTLQGSWKYDEYEWIAKAGSFVYEPAGEAHTLRILGNEPMLAFFHVLGPHITLDDEGKQVGYVDAFSIIEYLREYCQETGTDPSFLDTITS
jgi:quercetin dioxygenase-like cupin family protein